MKQYLGIKEQHSDAIVLFRLGDFYEMFGEDARVASRILQIALTSRDKGKDDPIPMCGVPYFSAETYITKLIRAGHKVAVCEQVEDPKTAKGIVRREVTRIVTPGTHAPSEPRENTYIMSIFPSRNITGIALADVSTGEFIVSESNKPTADEIMRFDPREVVIPSSLRDDIHFRHELEGSYITHADDTSFDHQEALRCLLRFFRVGSLEGYGCAGMTAAVCAAGALIRYLEETQKRLSFRKISVVSETDFMFLDGASKRNLELVRNLRDGTSEGTLLKILDATLTPMGGRLLRSCITRPLLSVQGIRKRLDSVDAVFQDYELRESLRTDLRKIQDIERTMSRILSRTAVPRDLLALRESIGHLPAIKSALASSRNAAMREHGTSLNECREIADLIAASIGNDPPANPRDGGVIRTGFSPEVDELRDLSGHAKDYIAKIETEERQRTGISSLKVGFNRVFGYYIEITKPNLHLVPADYTRKQTLVSGERFITPELKDYEGKVLGADEKLKEIEYGLFLGILDRIAQSAGKVFETSAQIASVDFISSLATIARRYDYGKPVVDDGDVIEITDGRHPVIERMIAQKSLATNDDRFVPNNTLLDSAENRLMIITGPNMAGKSTYMRQVALIVLMAQIGSFVPAAEARIGVADRIFTRIGASDYISRGQSTFMVEMIEAANILNNATRRSLVLLDEVGRGTSTFDGISIAWATAEYLANKIGSRSLFATHYNELTDLAFSCEGIRNYNIVVREWGDEIIFVRRIEKGPADKSYGIQVARLAGLPAEVIESSRKVLEKLERKEKAAFIPRQAQLNLFFDGDPVTYTLVNLDTETISPRKALSILRDLKKTASEKL